jgi:hypothetical protein
MMIVSILGTMIYTFFLSAFSESVTPITRLRASAGLHKVMANITADYNRYPRWRSGTVYTYSAFAATYVIPTNFNGHYYRLTNSGTSGAPGSEPDWPRSGTVNDNGITWTESGRLRTLKPLATLQGQIGAEGSVQNTNDYGKYPDGITYTKYTVVKNRFIKFIDDGSEIDDATGVNNLLKVTLQNETGETLTALFFSD